MLRSETLGKSTSNCSQKPLAGRSREMMSKASAWVDAEMRGCSHLQFGGFSFFFSYCLGSGLHAKPDGMLPCDKRVVRKRAPPPPGSFCPTPENQNHFLGTLLRQRHFLHVLNWPCHAVSSTGLPGADCFHTARCSVPGLVSRKIRAFFFFFCVVFAGTDHCSLKLPTFFPQKLTVVLF